MRGVPDLRAGTPGVRNLAKRPGNRWRGLIFAAGVALHHLGPTIERSERIVPPYVLLLPDNPRQFSEPDVVGNLVLTGSLDLSDPDDVRLAGNPN